MIAASAPGFAALAERLRAKAAALAEARFAGSERRWRSAALIWPLFGKG